MDELTNFPFETYAWAFAKIFLGWLLNIYVIATVIYFYKNRKEIKKLGIKTILIATLIVTVVAIVLSQWM